MFAQDEDSQPPAQTQTFPPDQLAAMVAPIALYPDPLLGQVLAASTYPLEIAEAEQWLQQNSNLQGQQLVEAGAQQNWDASVQALVVFPDVLNRLSSDIRWTTDLGNAFLAQQADVMNAVQRMRARRRRPVSCNSNAEQTVTTQTRATSRRSTFSRPIPQVVYVPRTTPNTFGDRPIMVIIRRCIMPWAIGFGTDSARASTSVGFSAAGLGMGRLGLGTELVRWFSLRERLLLQSLRFWPRTFCRPWHLDA